MGHPVVRSQRCEISFQFEFEKIGVEYSENVPVFALRFLPALCGALATPTVYLILTELGVSKWTGALAGVLLLLGMYSRLWIQKHFSELF